MFAATLALALLLVWVQTGRASGVTFRQLGINSTNFADVGQLSGQLWLGPLSDIRQVFYFGNDVTLTHGFNVTGLASPVTLTFVVAMRDVSKMPSVTLTDVQSTISRRTCMHSMSTLISAAPTLSGDSSASTESGTFPVGSQDSYNNVIASGDMMALDWAVYFDAPASNQNVTIDVYGQLQSFVLF